MQGCSYGLAIACKKIRYAVDWEILTMMICGKMKF